MAASSPDSLQPPSRPPTDGSPEAATAPAAWPAPEPTGASTNNNGNGNGNGSTPYQERRPRPLKPPFDRQRFVFKTLAVVIGTQLLIYTLAAGACAERSFRGRPVGAICASTLKDLQTGFDSTLNLLLALLGGAALTGFDKRP
jgi:hypothetical protein